LDFLNAFFNPKYYKCSKGAFMIKKMMLVGAMGTAVLFAGNQNVVALSELTDETIESFMQGKLQDTIVKCPAGMVLPLTLSLQGEFLALESEGGSSVKILKTCFVKCVGETYLFSIDGKSWKEFPEFFAGELRAEFHNTDKGPFARVDFKLDQK
jgi:hypothetical protein